MTTVVWAMIVGLVMLVGGGYAGFRAGRKRGELGSLSAPERERMRHLLLDLNSWTSEYSGNVTQYQDQLGRIEQAVRDTEAGSSGSDGRVLTLLQQIMSSNDQLKDRLDKAEKRLEKQTLQIESYLNEARTDGLTGLANRRAFDQKIEELFLAYGKGGSSFILALIDIDRFKSINDNHGHQIGDKVLQELGHALNHDLKSALMVARFGGEEFAVLLETPLRRAADTMNEFRRDFARKRIDIGQISLEVTMSIGVAEPRDDAVIASVIRRADEAMYTAKNIGRNRVYYHDGKAPVLVGAPEVAR